MLSLKCSTKLLLSMVVDLRYLVAIVQGCTRTLLLGALFAHLRAAGRLSNWRLNRLALQALVIPGGELRQRCSIDLDPLPQVRLR